ncbi:hypothetical protein TI04_03535 [Achromatium sp. WMS2]|nr:hypothetical protein TI04_03535 [Achromatium sp. WMS2]
MPTAAGPLTRGNVFAEGLAGCSVGVALGILGVIAVGPQVTVAGGRAGIVNLCLIGGVIGASLHSVMDFINSSEGTVDVHGMLDNKPPMVYPETPN